MNTNDIGQGLYGAIIMACIAAAIWHHRYKGHPWPVWDMAEPVEGPGYLSALAATLGVAAMGCLALFAGNQIGLH